MGDKEYQHDNVYHCVCLTMLEIVKLKRGNNNSKELYKASKAYVVMSKHPFLSLHMDILTQVVQIFKY